MTSLSMPLLSIVINDTVDANMTHLTVSPLCFSCVRRRRLDASWHVWRRDLVTTPLINVLSLSTHLSLFTHLSRLSSTLRWMAWWNCAIFLPPTPDLQCLNTSPTRTLTNSRVKTTWGFSIRTRLTCAYRYVRICHVALYVGVCHCVM